MGAANRIGWRGGDRLSVVVLAAALAVPLAAAPANAAGDLLLPYRILAVPSEADAVAIGDVTGDGRADVVATTGYSNDPAVDFHLLVLAQVPGGSLASPVAYATAGSYPARPGSLALADVTGDGRLDVVVGLDRSGIQVFPGQADGTLGAPAFTGTGDSTRVATGNLDGVGGLDVAGIGWGSNTITTLSWSGGALVPTATYAARHGGYDDLEIGDVTGDHRDDLVVMSGQGLLPNLSILAQRPTGGFAAAAEYSVGNNALTAGIGLGDVTGDGRIDVVASYGGNRPSSSLAVFAQTPAGTLAVPVSYPSYDIPEPVAIQDLDADGRADTVTMHGGWLRAGVYRGLPGGTLAAEDLYTVTYASHYNAQGLALGDINGDGAADVVEADYNEGLIVLLNSGVRHSTPPAAPTMTSAIGGDRTVSLGWAAPGADGGSPVTSYTATAAPGGATCTTNGLGCVIGGLANGTAYAFTVHATNAIGSSAESNALWATPATVPSTPRSLSAKSGQGGISLKWSAPTSNGGSAISGYRLYRGTTSGGESLLATVNANATSFVDTAVARKTKYFYWLTAFNARGESSRSSEVSATAR